MVHHLIKSRKSTPISHYGKPYSGIEDYEMNGWRQREPGLLAIRCTPLLNGFKVGCSNSSGPRFHQPGQDFKRVVPVSVLKDVLIALTEGGDLPKRDAQCLPFRFTRLVTSLVSAFVTNCVHAAQDFSKRGLDDLVRLAQRDQQ